MKCFIHDVDLVCPICLAIERGRKGGRTKHRHSFLPRQQKSPTVYGLFDCLEAFMQHPEEVLNRKKLIEYAAPEKRASAKRTITNRLWVLKRNGSINQVRWGYYKLIVTEE